MKKKTILHITLTILIALVFLLTLTFLFWLGPTAKAIVGRIGPKALGTPVAIEYLSINPRKGTIDLRGFQIGTHEGFNRANTWQLAKFHIAIDMRSLFSDTIIIHKIQIDSPHLIYEQNQATDNISEFIQNIQAFLGIDPNAPKVETKKPKEDDNGAAKESKKVIVEQLEITDIQIHLANTDDPQLDIQFSIEQVSLCLTNGTVQLQHLTLSDPGQLSTPNVIELESINIHLDPDSIYSGQIVIEDIQITKPHAFLEQNDDTDTIAEFMRLAQTFINKKDQLPEPEKPESPASATEASDSSPEPPPFKLHNLFVNDIQLKLLDTTRTNTAPEVRTMAAIDSISVRLAEGRVQIKEIVIPNPDADFISTNLFHLAHIGITIDPESIHSGQIIVTEIFVDSPEITLEQTENNGNVAELQSIIQSFIPTPKAESATAESAALPAKKTKEPIPLTDRPVVFEALIVTNFIVHMITPSETNAPSTGALGKFSLGKLRPKEIWFSTAESNAPTTLIAFEHLSVEPLKGLIQVDNLKIGNPKGFAHDNLATLRKFRIDLDFDSIQTGTLFIEDILIDTPRIAYERQITTDNIKALQASIETVFSKRADIMDEKKSKKPPTPEPPQTDEETSEKKVIIEHLLVQNGQVKAKVSALPSAPIPLPNIERNNMGKEEGGVGATDMMANLGTLFYDSIIGAVSSITGFAGDALKGVGTLTLGTITTATGDLLGTSEPSDPNITEEAPAKEKEKKRKRRIFRGRSF